MPLYEHVFLSRQDVSAQQVESMTQEFSRVLETGGGKVVKTEQWGIKGLAYKIKKNRKAHMTMLHIDAPHAAVAEMERQMSLSTDVLRFLTLREEELDSDASPMMKKSDRDDRRGRRGGGGRDRDGGGRRDDGPRRERRDEAPAE
ncbi:MAG: 30S ribosomal protein S6 [Pseudomonadota bacterium]